jgi:UDP-glucose:tetrahydrobiopterin glucosyltransferase
MASITDAMDDAIEERLLNAPFSVAMHSKAQAETFALGHQAPIIGSGVAVERYDFVQQVADNAPLGFIGRVSPEKGILDLFHIASVTKRHVKVWGLMQDALCWEEARRAYPTANVTYEGFLPTDQLQGEVGQCAAVLMTSKWVEAFGNVAIEAMACGVPVVSYRRGGPSEVILHGETGFLVEPDDIAGMVAALAGVPALSRQRCRTHVETEFSTKAFAVRSEMWLREAVRQFHAVS